MKTKLPTDITSIADVIAFCDELTMNDEMFHFDDDPREIILNGEPMFTEDEAQKLDSIITQMFVWTEDPFLHACEALEKVNNSIKDLK